MRAGNILIRTIEWSQHFLDLWWSYKNILKHSEKKCKFPNEKITIALVIITILNGILRTVTGNEHNEQWTNIKCRLIITKTETKSNEAGGKRMYR